jgi:Zn-dependent M28 family amino/carboxypeptidase
MKLFYLLSVIAFSLTANALTPTDIYQTIYNSADPARLQMLLKDMTGYNSVTVNGETFRISNRYEAVAKQNFRKYWSAYFRSLGLQVNELPYSTAHKKIESQGHNLEAILPGQSPDTVVIIVHYDSMGPNGPDNPGVDDDMTGMAQLMETARILSQYRGRLQHTVRFVAADFEEWGTLDLEGAREYVKYLQNEAALSKFKIVAAIDDEQCGWKEGAHIFDLVATGLADSVAFGDLLESVAKQYSTLATKRESRVIWASDGFAFSDVGVPTVTFLEHDAIVNDHFDNRGGDTFEKIDLNYFTEISRVSITFAAKTVGIQN